MKYSYYAVFDYAADGINITFPDVSNVLSCAEDTDSGILMAEEALCLSLHGMPVEEIPAATALASLALRNDQKAFLICVDLEIKDGKLFSADVEDCDFAK